MNEEPDLEEQPFYKDGEFEKNIRERIASIDEKAKRDINIFSKVKAHELVSIIVLLLFIIMAVDTFSKEKKLATSIVDVFKTLIFSLTGYLFGQRNKD